MKSVVMMIWRMALFSFDLGERRSVRVISRVIFIEIGPIHTHGIRTAPLVVRGDVVSNDEEGPAVVEAVLAAEPAHRFVVAAAQDFTPEHDGTEGFFVARLDRDGG